MHEHMNTELYPWLTDLSSPEAKVAIEKARCLYFERGAVVFSQFVTSDTIATCVATSNLDAAYSTDESHTPYLKDVNTELFPPHSVYNHSMRTRVASLPYDHVPSPLADLYHDPRLLQLVSMITEQPESATGKQRKLYHSADPLGCCSINVFHPGDYHSFHFDESEFSTTLMLQEAESGGLFQYTDPLRKNNELATTAVAHTIRAYDGDRCGKEVFAELENVHRDDASTTSSPPLHTLDFHPGTLSIFSGSRSLHRVTTCEGTKSRLVAVLTFASVPGFCNSAAVQRMFWGRSARPKES